MTEDLFSAAASVQLHSKAPLAARLRPRTLDDVVGQQHLVGPQGPLRKLVEGDKLSSALLWGPAGTGKTTLAKVVARSSAKHFEQLSAVNASVKDVRAVLAAARNRLGSHGRGTILFLDEVHRFSKSQQDALLPGVESGIITFIGATTENPFFEVNAPLRSRSTLFRLHLLETDDLLSLLRRGLVLEEASADDDALEYLTLRANGDGRQALTTLEVAVALASTDTDTEDSVRVTLAHAEAATDLKALRCQEVLGLWTELVFQSLIRGQPVPQHRQNWVTEIDTEDINFECAMSELAEDTTAVRWSQLADFYNPADLAKHLYQHTIKPFQPTRPTQETSKFLAGRFIAKQAHRALNQHIEENAHLEPTVTPWPHADRYRNLGLAIPDTPPREQLDWIGSSNLWNYTGHHRLITGTPPTSLTKPQNRVQLWVNKITGGTHDRETSTLTLARVADETEVVNSLDSLLDVPVPVEKPSPD